MIDTAALDGSAVMVVEAHHRFFNSLQLIVSETNGILRQGTCDPYVRERLAALQDRVVQLAGINRRLSGPYGPESVSSMSLEMLCKDLTASFERSGTLIAVTVEGCVQSPGRCRTLLLLVSELMTNALKHGRLDVDLRIRIDLVATADETTLDVYSNTSPRSGSRPRIAAELAVSSGGWLEAIEQAGGFLVKVVIPNDAPATIQSSHPGCAHTSDGPVAFRNRPAVR